MQFEKEAKLYSYETAREGGEDVLYINYFGVPYVPSISENYEDMERVIDCLIENPNVSRIVLSQQKNYNYDLTETSMLLEIAQFYVYLMKQENILSQRKLITNQHHLFAQRYNKIFSFLLLLKRDPVSAYSELKKLIIEGKIAADKILNEAVKLDYLNYIYFLEKIFALFEKTKLIQIVQKYFKDYQKGSREIYNKIFKPDVIPNFTFTRLVSDLPDDAEIIDQYKIFGEEYDESLVTILKTKDESKLIYHLSPPEHSLSEEHNLLLNLARTVLIEHQPKAEELTDSERIRSVFFNISRDLLRDLANTKGIKLSYQELNKLAIILVRNTLGFGLVEVLLQDKNIQDISLNSPIARVPIYIKHGEYDECLSNIRPSQEDADSWAAKFRMISGRPLDEANPILDTQLEIGKLRARIAIIQKPLSADGMAYSIRRHRESPWTLPLFIKNKMLNPFAAGLLSFLIDGSRTLLVAGTRSSGKTSLLGSLMLEIIPKYRIIVIEDSVTGDSKMIVKENGKFRKTTIGELIDKKIEEKGFRDSDGREKVNDLEDIEIFSVNENGKVILAQPSKFIRHKVNKPIYEIVTTSGRKIKVTGDHSLFGLDEKNILKEVKACELKEGGFIAIPSILPFDNSLKRINLLEHLDKFNKKLFICGEKICKHIEQNKEELFSLASSLNYKKSTIQNWIKKKILPIQIFEKIKNKIGLENLFIKYKDSDSLPILINLDKHFLNLVGLWLADGCYDKRSVILSVMEEENKKVVKEIAERFNLGLKTHSDKFSLMINSILFKEVMQKILNLNGNSYTKKIPLWAHNLSDEQAGWLLKGYFSGDGCASDKEIIFSSCSKELIDDISIFLLRFGIILRVSDKRRGRISSNKKFGVDNTISCRIGSTKMLKNFKEKIGFLVDSKNENLNKLCSRISTHDTSDIIPISASVKEELYEILGDKFSKKDYIKRGNNIGREHLGRLLEKIPAGTITNPIDPLRAVISSDIFWDKIKSIKKINFKEQYVYDISVPKHENFICENIVAHNTLELPVESLRKLQYNILRMKVRSALLKSGTEVSADDGIRTSLRLGDSALIIGEIRSTEAEALYEAMRVGALANVVAGTIHGASPYGVFDRVVNDLKVPATSFKATDIIAVCNPIKSPDGLHSWKRMLHLAEVRKHWREDPLAEKGFVDLLKYNVKKDELEPTDDLINGDSETLKDIASNVRGWAGNWDAIYDNVLLRAKIKKEVVEVAEKTNNSEILEAKFNTLSNHAFHRISDEVIQEIGLPLGEKVFPLWQKWLNQEIKKTKI